MALPVYRENVLQDKLKELTETLDGIRGAVIVSIEGFVVAAYPTAAAGRSTFGMLDTPQIAAMAATLFALGEQTMARLEQGTIDRLLVEGASGAMIIYPIDNHAILATMVKKDAKMGLTLLTVARTAKTLSKILSGVR